MIAGKYIQFRSQHIENTIDDESVVTKRNLLESSMFWMEFDKEIF